MITSARIQGIDRFRSDGLGVMHFSRRECTVAARVGAPTRYPRLGLLSLRRGD